MNTFLSLFAPENLVWRDGFGRPVPLQPALLLTSASTTSIKQQVDYTTIVLSYQYNSFRDPRGRLHKREREHTVLDTANRQNTPYTSCTRSTSVYRTNESSSSCTLTLCASTSFLMPPLPLLGRRLPSFGLPGCRGEIIHQQSKESKRGVRVITHSSHNVR